MNSKIKKTRFMFHASCFLLLVSCFMFHVSARAETVERIVAVVGGDIVTLYDLDLAMAPHLSEINKSMDKVHKYKDVKSEVLNKLVDDLLLKQAIETAKVTATNDDLARYIKNMLAQSHVTIDILKAELASKGISFEAFKEDMRKNIQKMKFINQEIGSRVKISDQDMHDYYLKHMEEFGVHQSIHLAQIVLPFDENMTEAKANELKAKSNDIAAKLKSGTPFGTLANEYSKGPNAEKGGDLGVIDPSNLLPEVAAAVQKMNIGQTSDPIISPAGIHIVKLIDRAKAGETDFDKMKDAIYNKMYDQRVMDELNQYLSEMRKKTYVEMRE